MYKCADVSVFPSTYEPFGIVALEAMLAGVPTVVSDVGGLNEIVDHRINGMKSYAGNPNSLADSILELLLNPELCDKVTKQAKIKVKDEYNVSLALTFDYGQKSFVAAVNAKPPVPNMQNGNGVG